MAFGPGNINAVVSYRNTVAFIIVIDPECITSGARVQPGLVQKAGYLAFFIYRTVGAHQTIGITEFQKADGILQWFKEFFGRSYPANTNGREEAIPFGGGKVFGTIIPKIRFH